MYRLVFLNGKDRGKRLAINEATVTIGRDPDCAIQIEDDEVSRKHALIEQRADGVYIKDLGATNPTLLNNTPVQEARLQNGDRIELGNTLLEFQTLSEIKSAQRRVSYMEGLTTMSVALVIIVQLLFLAYLASRHKRIVQTPTDATPVQTSAPAPSSEETSPPGIPPLAAEPAPDQPPPEQPPAKTAQSPEPRAAETSAALVGLRTDVEALRRDVEQIPAEPETRALPSEPVPVPSNVLETTPSPAETDAILLRAEAMLRQAAAEIARMNLVQADELLQRIQIMAPDFLPAYIERARLFEQRGMLKQAGEQWTEVLNRSIGTPLYEQAAAERIRIGRLLATQTVRRAPPTQPTLTDRRLPRRIRILDVQQERFPKNEQFDEMRLLRITLKPRPTERDLDPTHIKIVVTFFDENTETLQVRPTRAVTSKILSVDYPWLPNQTKTVSATYIVPRGFRQQEEEQTGERMLYFGYIVQVYYREQLQDMDYKPATLAEQCNAVPSPFHKPPVVQGIAL